MKRYQRWTTFVLVPMILGIAGAAVVAMAASEQPWGSSGEPGTFPSDATRVSVTVDAPDEGNVRIDATATQAWDVPGSAEGSAFNENPDLKPTDLQPDDDGYTGPLPVTTNNEIPPSTSVDASTPPDWSTFFTEPQPDDRVDSGITDDVGISWSASYYYYHAAGSAFRPRDSSVNWGNDGSGGCLYLT